MDLREDVEIPLLDLLKLPSDESRKPSVDFDFRLTPSPEQRLSPSDLSSRRQRFGRLSDYSRDSNTSVRPKKCSKLNLLAIRLMVFMVFIGFCLFFYKYFVYLSNKS